MLFYLPSLLQKSMCDDFESLTRSQNLQCNGLAQVFHFKSSPSTQELSPSTQELGKTTHCLTVMGTFVLFGCLILAILAQRHYPLVWNVHNFLKLNASKQYFTLSGRISKESSPKMDLKSIFL